MSAVVLAAIAGPIIGLSMCMAFLGGFGWRVLSVAERVAMFAAALCLGWAGAALLIHAINLEGVVA